MNNSGWGGPNILSRAVEDPIEATFELSEDLKKQNANLNLAVNLGIIVSCIFLITIIPNLYNLFSTIYEVIIGQLEITFELYLQTISTAIALVVLMAVIASALIFLIQVKRFYSHIFPRYRSVSELKEAGIGEDTDEKTISDVSGKHRANPILAMLDLVEEGSHRIYKIIDLLEFCKYLFSFVLVFLIVNIALNLLSDFGLLIISFPWEYILHIIPLILFIPTIIFIDRSRKFLIYFQTRHEIIDNVRFGRELELPSGKNPLERLIKYLTISDPYIKRAVEATGKSFQQGIVLKDPAGGEHKFDAYLHGERMQRSSSGHSGIPPGKFTVFIKVYKKPITIGSLQEMRSAVSEICSRDNSVPLRVIALQWRIEDLEDEVYEFVLENPIIIKGQMFQLQIIAEDGETYSFIPNISYEKEVR